MDDLTQAAQTFLARFVWRGWIHAVRDDGLEQAAVDLGLRNGWLRRELNEAHFTTAGRAALRAQDRQDAPGPACDDCGGSGRLTTDGIACTKAAAKLVRTVPCPSCATPLRWRDRGGRP